MNLNIKNDLDDIVKMKNHNDQRKNNNTKIDEDKLATIVRPWEELEFKQNWYGLGYEKDHGILFHNLDHYKPIKFMNGGFLDGVKDNDTQQI